MHRSSAHPKLYRCGFVVASGILVPLKPVNQIAINYFLIFLFFLFSYIYIIIMSCHRHGYPQSSLATSPYRSSPLVGFQGHIPYPHIAAECMFEMVVLLLPGHMWGSIGVHHLWARSCFSVWFVLRGIYIKEQTEHIQNQIDQIRDSVEHRQSRIDLYYIYTYIYVCMYYSVQINRGRE